MAGLFVHFAHGLQQATHEPHVVSLADQVLYPDQQAERRGKGHNHQPEPNQQVDLLIEEVYGEYALHRVALQVAQLSDAKVAHGRVRET